MTAGRSVWQPACIALGSNLSSPSVRLEEAAAALAADPAIRIYAASGVYRSEPLGGVEQPDFLNAVLRIMTSYGPHSLLQALKTVESDMGRDPDAPRWGPRIIDLDLLVYGSLSLDDGSLTVPHPGIAGRNFVLLPLAEIAPDLIVPGLGRVGRLPVPDEPAITRVGDTLSGTCRWTPRSRAS